MKNLKYIAGIILAGGRSSRMGKNKALLNYHGKPLIEHMMEILQKSEIKNIFISGMVDGYKCIEDDKPYNGPAFAIRNILRQKPNYEGYLFIPVDMPLLTPEILHRLLSQENGGCFFDCPMPLFITPPVIMDDSSSVQGFIDKQKINSLEIPYEWKKLFINANTPKEWQEALEIR